MPGETSPYMGNYNLWKGFNVSPKAFNPTEPDNVEGFSIFWDHIINNIANGNDKSAMYVIGWMADMVQHPRKRLGVSLVLRSDEQGTGKGLFEKKYLVIYSVSITFMLPTQDTLQVTSMPI